MTCYSPLTAYQGKQLSKKGTRIPVFNPNQGYRDLPTYSLKCGRCIGCRLEYSRQWAVRCYHEAQMHEHNCFLTLTFNGKHVPRDGSVRKEHIQLFMKRLRKSIEPQKVRYFACGEYGELNSRPHYHVCLFGYDFPHKTLYYEREEIKLYTSGELDSIWAKDGEPLGFSTIGALTYQTAAYTSRYMTKKLYGKEAELYEELGIEPEFVLMSRRPGLGATWYEKYGDSDAHDHDRVVVDGKIQAVPTYYDKLLEQEDPDLLVQIKADRVAAALDHAEDNTKDRLRVKEKVRKLRVRNLKRPYEAHTSDL